MDNERRDSISGESKWGKDYSVEDIMSREEAMKAVYANVPDADHAAGGSDPADNGEELSDDIFKEWVDNFYKDADDSQNESETDETPVTEADAEEPADETGGTAESDADDITETEEDAGEPADESDADETPVTENDAEELADETGGTAESDTDDITETEDDAEEPADESDADETPGAEGDNAEEAAGSETAETGNDEPVGPETGTVSEPDPPVPPAEDPEKQKKRRMIIGGIAGLCVIAVIAGTQIHKHYTEYYSTHFFKGTVINGTDVSQKTVDEVKEGIVSKVSRYDLKIKELDRDERITAGDIGLEYVDDGKVDELMEEQEESKWLFHLTGSTDFDVHAGTKYNEEMMTAAIAGLECFKEENITPPQDACLKDENNVFSIQNEVEGNAVNLEKLTKAVTEAVRKGKSSIDIVKDDCYEHPTVYRDDETLKARMDKWNEYMRVNVTYAFGDNIEVVNADTVKPNVVDDGTTVDLPTDWIRGLVYGWGQKYDTFGLAREFTTHSGEVVTVPEGGDYGWVIDKDATIADVTDAVLTGAQGERTPTFLYSAMGWDNGDLTGTYVEVSISEQHLWCYKDYELVMDTDVVTGLPTTERATTPGTFAVDAKKEDATLGSLDVQGYESPVSFWAPFNGGQGLHDAPWRSDFGGDIYMSNGSHGCVNIPPWNMEPIYNAIEIGTAVVVY